LLCLCLDRATIQGRDLAVWFDDVASAAYVGSFHGLGLGLLWAVVSLATLALSWPTDRAHAAGSPFSDGARFGLIALAGVVIQTLVALTVRSSLLQFSEIQAVCLAQATAVGVVRLWYAAFLGPYAYREAASLPPQQPFELDSKLSNKVQFSFRSKTDQRLAVLVATVFGLLALWPRPFIELCDESRQAVSALEMWHNGWSVAQTFHGSVDFWNTKPPLLFWAITASFKLFGPNLFALRLPPAIFSAITLGFLYWFVVKLTHNRKTGFLAALILAASPGFFGTHSGSFADFEAPLIAFVTMCAAFTYLAVHGPNRLQTRYWLLAGAALAGAALTKGIAAALIIPGLLLYIVLSKRSRQVFASSSFYLALAVAIMPIALYYSARAMQSPDYLHTLYVNELGGRYGAAQGVKRPIWYFVPMLLLGMSAIPAIFLAPRSLADQPGRSRSFFRFAVTLSAAFLVVISLASTKCGWYCFPVIPLLSAAIAVACSGNLFSLFSKVLHPRWAKLAFAALLLFISGRVAYHWYRVGHSGDTTLPRAAAAIERLGRGHRYAIVDSGAEAKSASGMELYTPQAYFFAERLNYEGYDVTVVNYPDQVQSDRCAVLYRADFDKAPFGPVLASDPKSWAICAPANQSPSARS
jgi:4-amino-4-deoxy-L-arabinose transferase-like glycosyltransferase